MKKVFILLTLCAVLLSSCSGQAPGSKDSASSGTTALQGQTSTEAAVQSQGVSDYFPFTADVYKKYKGTGNEYAGYETYVDYADDQKMQVRKNNGGTETVTVYAIKDGALVKTYSREETYYRYDYTAMTGDEEILLKEPIAAGTTWMVEDGVERSITDTAKKIETPSGAYSAVEVTTKRKDSTSLDYYVKDVGLVKSVFQSQDASMTVTSELEAIEKDHPFKRAVRFYFPQFDENRIVYIQRDIALRTNEDMKAVFEKELKNIPAEGGLAKTFTANTKILNIGIDDNKGTVTIDLSSDFIKEMNAGSGFEGMLLDSVTTTIGEYYGKSKVVLLIEGKPYESGHILMRQGETFEVKEGVAEFK